VVVLWQLGVDLGPVLAGLGIVGVVIGLGMQSTLANFAAGGLLLAYQPFDVGDTIETGGAVGTVQRMNLVSTTILTQDNQTVIVPNSKIWSDVIRNVNAQPTRRVDLTFGLDHKNDVAKVEGALREIVAGHALVRKEPPPVAQLHQVTDTGMSFIVRVWVLTKDYWTVNWDLSRAVKLRFDQEGIVFPQRDVNVKMTPPATQGPK